MLIKEGLKLDNLTIVKLDHINKSKYNRTIRFWNCLCDCGNNRIVSERYLKETKTIKNCGCIKLNKCIEWGKNRKLLNQGSAFNRLYNKYIESAKRRNYNFELTKDNFKQLTSRKCYYCSIEPKQDSYSNGSKTSNYIYNGIDRIDNTKGYIIDNVRTCCKICNFAKRNLTEYEFKEWIIRVIKNNIYLLND